MGCPAGSGSITVGRASIASGTSLRVLYDNAGVVGEYTNVQLTALIAAFTTPVGCVRFCGGSANFLRADGTWASPAGAAFTMNNIAIVRVLAANDSLAVNAGLYLPEFFEISAGIELELAAGATLEIGA